MCFRISVTFFQADYAIVSIVQITPIMHFSGYDFFQSANSLEITGGDETGCIGPSQFNRQQIDWFIAEFGTSVAKKLKIVCKIVLLQNIPELFCERRLPLSNGYNLIIEYEREEQVTIKG